MTHEFTQLMALEMSKALGSFSGLAFKGGV